MDNGSALLFANLDPAIALVLMIASFAGSLITVSMGIGGGVLLLSVMASLLPPSALIAVHGVIQLGSNFTRAGVLAPHVHWRPVAVFALGSAIGVAVGGMVVIDLPPALIQIGIGVFVIWGVLANPPVWLAKNPLITGGLASFLTMFFGATGVFVANFTKSLALERRSHVATHAVLMTVQHGLKILAFGLLGFSFGPWMPFIGAMILSGFVGTLIGQQILVRIGDKTFKRALDIVLILISLRLIWVAALDLL